MHRHPGERGDGRTRRPNELDLEHRLRAQRAAAALERAGDYQNLTHQVDAP
jgi:hypothetical protein